MPNDWSKEEAEAIVADYFSMLESDLKGLPYSKTQHRRNLQKLLNKRTEGSIEYKYQNISGVLYDLGFLYIPGYKPALNYQKKVLPDIVSERLNKNQKLFVQAEEAVKQIIPVPQVDDILKILISPPRHAIKPNKVREKRPTYRPRPFNYLEREANNQSLGLAGEEFILNYERAVLISKGQESLAAKIEHVSKTRGDGDGFDILSFEVTGKERLIEVKTTKYDINTPFYISRNEVSVSKDRSEQYHLYRLFDFRTEPRLFTLSGALTTTCLLEPDSYVATVA